MEPDQQAFLETFKAWDGARMGESLARMVESFGGKPLAERTRAELTLQCRELLRGMEAKSRLGSIMEIPELDLQLVLSSEVEWSGEAGGGQPARFKLHIRPGADQPPSVRDRWRQHGFTDQPMVMERHEVRAPAPLKEEAGRAAVDAPMANRPASWKGIRAEQTYAYGLSLEARAQKPRLQRYQAGDCERVWAELVAMGEGVRDESVFGDAVAVARETMRRCRMNVETLVAHLRQKNYVFRNEELAHVAPDFDIREKIAGLEREVGPLPLSLCAWYEIVGSADLTGRFEGEGEQSPDPLLMLPAGFVLQYDDGNWRRERYVMTLSPDYYHKADTSGGPPYSMALPDGAADALVCDEWHNTTFVNYLRTCFLWGGMPGLGLKKGARPQDEPYAREVKKMILPV